MNATEKDRGILARTPWGEARGKGLAGQIAASACSSDSGATQRGASATRAAMVLCDLLQRADKRTGELAVAYKRARIAGLACEPSYESMHQ